MPRIQRQTARTGPVAPQPTPEQFGAAEGRGLVRLGQEAEAVVRDAASIYDAHMRTEVHRRAVEGESRQRQIAEQARLQNFKDREKWFATQQTEVLSDLTKGLSPGRAADLRTMLNQSRNRWAAHVRGSVYRDATKESELNLAHTLEGLAESAATSDSDVDVRIYRERGLRAIEDYAESFGVGEAQVREMWMRFEDNVESLRAPVMREKQARALSDEILTTVDDQGNLLSREARLELVGQIEDDELREDVKRRVKVTTDREEAERQEGLRLMREAAWTAVLEGAGEEAIPAELPADERRKLLSHVAKQAEAGAKSRSLQIETDPVLWDSLVSKRVSDPDGFAQVNLWKHRDKLERADFNELKREQEALLQGTEVDGVGPAISGSDRTFLNDTMRSAGITDTETQASMRLAYKRAAEKQREQVGRELNLEERERIAQEMMSEINVPGFMGMTILAFGETKRIGDLTEEDGQRIVENPPDELRRMAIDSLRSRGVPEPGPDQVEAAIRALLKRYGVPGVE